MRGIELEKLVSEKLNRHTLKNWRKFLTGRIALRKGADDYSPEQAALLIRMLQATTRDEVSPGKAAERAAHGWFERQKGNIDTLLEGMALVGVELISKESSELQIALLQEQASIPANVLRRGVSLDRFASMLRTLLDARECSILLPDRADQQDLILVADSKGAGEPTQLGHRIRNYSKSKLAVAQVADTKARINLLAPIGQDESNADNRSLLAISLMDRKKALRAVIQAEDKLPPDKSMKFGAFDDQDELLMTAVGASLLPLLELQRLLVRGINILDRLSAPGPADQVWAFSSFAMELVRAALNLVSADHAEVSTWDPTRGLVFQAVDDNNVLKVGEALEPTQVSVTYKVYWNAKAEHHPNVSLTDHFRPCNVGIHSEIAVPLLAPSSDFREGQPPCFGVLNVESGKVGGAGGLEKADLSMLASLATFGSVAFQLAELKNCLGDGLSVANMDEIRLKVIAIATRITDKPFEAAIYLVDYVAGRLILKVPDIQVEPLKFEGENARALVLRVIEEKKGLFSVLPETDPRVWLAGLEMFKIRGSLIGIPLLFRTGLRQTVVAVISLWNVTPQPERLTHAEAQEIIQRCEKELVLELRLKQGAPRGD